VNPNWSRFPYASTLDPTKEVLMVKLILSVRPKPKKTIAFCIGGIAYPEHSIVALPFF
jgi:hypothetical protein